MPQLAPFADGPDDDLVQIRVMLQEGSVFGLHQPSDVGLWVGFAESGCQGGSEDIVAHGTEPYQQDTWRCGQERSSC